MAQILEKNPLLNGNQTQIDLGGMTPRSGSQVSSGLQTSSTLSMPSLPSAHPIDNMPPAQGYIPMDDQGTLQESQYAEAPAQEQSYEEHPDDGGLLEFQLPKYGYAQYINDMSAWQKQIREVNGEIGWFYFKVFFNFNTEYGLLGGLERKTANVKINSMNSAIKYLESISTGYEFNKIPDRIVALYKFGNTLKHISLDSPWYFKALTGLEDIPYPYTSEFQKERKINIVCSEESVDMRIGTLMDLYKYACFDNINCKEIIPKNLRKFEMTVMVMHVPLKFHHEPSILVNGDNLETMDTGKGIVLTGNDFSTLASFKMFTFQNCEFDLEQLGAYYGDKLNNETPFSLGKSQLSIKYDRVFEHRMNEWNEFLLGDDGFYYNNTPLSNIDEEDISNMLVNNTNYTSKHRNLLWKINTNHADVTEKLVSYSEYFLNKVWLLSTNSGKWADLIANFKSQTRNISNKYNNMRSSFSNLRRTFGKENG